MIPDGGDPPQVADQTIRRAVHRHIYERLTNARGVVVGMIRRPDLEGEGELVDS